MVNQPIPLKLTSEIRLMIIAAFVVQIGLWVYTWFAFKRAGDIIPLHYSIYFGTDFIGSKAKLCILPGAAGIFLFVDFALAYIFKKKDPLISCLLIIAGTSLQVVTFLASIPIIQNIR